MIPQIEKFARAVSPKSKRLSAHFGTAAAFIAGALCVFGTIKESVADPVRYTAHRVCPVDAEDLATPGQTHLDTLEAMPNASVCLNDRGAVLIGNVLYVGKRKRELRFRKLSVEDYVLSQHPLAAGMNNKGQIVANIEMMLNSANPMVPSVLNTMVLLHGHEQTVIPNPPGPSDPQAYPYSTAVSINDAGQVLVTGQTQYINDAANHDYSYLYDTLRHKYTRLPDPVRNSKYRLDTVIHSPSNSSVLAGYYCMFKTGKDGSDLIPGEHAFMRKNGKEYSIGRYSISSEAVAVNDSGEVVGNMQSGPADKWNMGDTAVFLCRQGRTYNLSDLIEGSHRPRLIESFAINRSGQVFAADRHYFYLLTPTSR